jgi:hypothetical protein
MRGGRRVDMMSTLVKGGQEILHLKEHPRGQCLETSQEAACTLIWRLRRLRKILWRQVMMSPPMSKPTKCLRYPPPPSENSSEDDVKSIESELRRQVGEEE